MNYPNYSAICPEGVTEVRFSVKKEHTDDNGQIRLACMAKEMEKVTEYHLSTFGIDRESLKARDKAWVILWTEININELPREGEEVILRMWPGKKKTMMYTRQYCFYTSEGQPLASAASLFALMNLKSRNISMAEKEADSIPAITLENEAALPKMMEKMPPVYDKNSVRKVVSGEIDKNGHMNNTCYLDWADDIRRTEDLYESSLERVWVKYSSELREGQECTQSYKVQDDELFITGTCDGNESFSIKMKYRKPEKKEEKMSFIENIIEKAKQNRQKIAVPEFTNEYMLKAAVKANKDGLAEIILVGEPSAVNEAAQKYGLDIQGIRIADISDELFRNELLDKYEAMKEKIMPRKFVEKRVADPLYFATLMEAVGEADATIAGVDTTTYEFVLAASSIIGLEKGCPSASGSLIMEIEGWKGEQGNIFACSDGAVCIEPNVQQHAYIATGACDTFEAITGTKARCAFLSYSTDGSGGASEPVKKIRAAMELAQKNRPDLAIDGEFQADAAIDARVGAKKVKRESEVAGKANVLIFPDAAACNICTKMVQRLGGATVYGPLYQGFRKPILDCSRSDTDDILYNDMALLSVLAAARK